MPQPRYDFYNQLKLWSGHGAGGQTVRQAEEVERDILLKSLRGSEERRMKAQRLESGALRRMRYVHWAAAQLLCVGPVLPLHEARTPRASLLTAPCSLLLEHVLAHHLLAT